MRDGGGDGRGTQRCWANLRCQGVLLISIVGQGPIVLAISAGGGCVWIFFSCLSFYSPSLSDGRI